MEVSQTIHLGHYNNKQQILLVGEGDFSFSLSLARGFGSATNITATSLDTREELEVKYKNAKSNVEELERLGCTVVHGVIVHSMNTDYRVVKSTLYDRIIFNFLMQVFILVVSMISTPSSMQHQEVVRGFLRSASKMVEYNGGEIHVTHKMAYPFNHWNIKDLGLEVSVHFYKEMKFDTWQYPGYSNKRGSGSDSDSSFPVGESSTFMFKRHWW